MTRDPKTGEVIGFSTTITKLAESDSINQARIASGGIDDELAYIAIESIQGDLKLRDPRKQLRPIKRVTPKERDAHVAMQQFDGSYPVFGGQLLVHSKASENSLFINGRLSSLAAAAQSPGITPQAAEAAARAAYEKAHGDGPESAAPPELWVYDPSLLSGDVGSASTLVYRVKVFSVSYPTDYMVDAQSGAVVREAPLYHDIARVVEDCSLGIKDCKTDFFSAPHNYTFGRSEGKPARGKNPLPAVEIAAFPEDVDKEYAFLAGAHDFYQKRFGRNGANNNGGAGEGRFTPKEITRAQMYFDNPADKYDCPNAYWFGALGLFRFCGGLTVLDVAAHEYQHAVTEFSVLNNGRPEGLVYEGESGALNESFSDIFGEAVERHVTGTQDWLSGTGSIFGALRSLKNPSEALPDPISGKMTNGLQPDRTHSKLFYCGAFDAGGVHFNSGVLNHAAYLIARGGTFNDCTITGLGEVKEEALLYRTATTYLTPVSKFIDAYLGIRRACSDLFTQEECLEVEKALRAVELNQPTLCSKQERQPSQCSSVVDLCPEHPNQVNPGACGCGAPEADVNANGQPDCLDPNANTIPQRPEVMVRGGRLVVRMQKVPRAKYEITFYRKGFRPLKFPFKRGFARPFIGKPAVYTVSYRIRLGNVITPPSEKVKFKIRAR